MAVSSPLNRRYAEMPGSTGGIANRSTKAAGGVRSRFEHPEAFRQRMDAGRAANTSAPMPGGVQPPMMSRQDNILQARMDGSFDAKVDAFNKANLGKKHMDEAANITNNTMPFSAGAGGVAPTAGGAQPAVTPPAQFVSAPDGMGGNKMVRLPTPASQSGQPGQSSPPAGGTHTLSAPASAPAPRHTTSPAMPSAGGPTLDMLTPQVSTPRAPASGGKFTSMPPGSRDLYAEEKARAAAVTPPVTRNVTSNAPSPVTPPTPSRPGGMMGAAAQVAQGMQTAMQTTMSPAPVASSQVMPRAKAFLSAMQQQRMTPTTTTPAGVPAPSSSFTGDQADRYNTAMASISGPNAPRRVSPTPAPAVTPPPAPAPTLPNPQAPGFLARKAAANPGGIISKAAEASSMFKSSLKAGAQNISAAAQVVAKPVIQAAQAAGNLVQQQGQQQATKNPGGAASRLFGVQPPKKFNPRAILAGS